MYELKQAAGGSYYIESPAKVGLVQLGGGSVCLIDSGSDKDAGRKVRQHLDANGWHLTAIYNTHSNADHVGGNQYLQKQTGCAVYAPGMEQYITCRPVLEPSLLYGGYPPKVLRNKFLMAQESAALPLTPEVLPEGWEMIPLPGHFLDMAGFRTADDVVYLADCLASRETLDKYGIAFLYDVGAYIDTLEHVKSMEAALFVPSHAAAAEDIAPLAQYNIDCTREAAERIAALCTGVTFDEVLRGVFKAYGLEMSFPQYALMGSTVKSYLSYLLDGGQVAAEPEDGRLLWRKL